MASKLAQKKYFIEEKLSRRRSRYLKKIK